MPVIAINALTCLRRFHGFLVDRLRMIFDFNEIGHFIVCPVQFYSIPLCFSGCYERSRRILGKLVHGTEHTPRVVLLWPLSQLKGLRNVFLISWLMGTLLLGRSLVNVLLRTQMIDGMLSTRRVGQDTYGIALQCVPNRGGAHKVTPQSENM
uniref:Uncharacterized protein n=1 Tax=Rhizophagus irregularis (strain DAOM 181602 / DAOM 197198 / MUCL 43194) TaxID=747089 RepID=U9UUW8_RHIID